MNAYGRFWREARQRRGLTQAELSTQLGWASSQYVSNVERGICHYSLAHIVKLTEILKVSPKQVLRLIMGEEEIRLRKVLNKKSCGSE